MTKARENSDYTGLAADIVAGDTAARAGRKNIFINGDFSVNQRGTGATTGGTYLTADRWKAGATTVTFETVANDRDLSIANMLKVTSHTNGYGIIVQAAEDVRTTSGQNVTLSFWAKTANFSSFRLEFQQNFGSGGSGTVTVVDNASYFSVPNTGWNQYTATIAMPSISGKTVGTSSYLNMVLGPNSGTSNGITYYSEVQLELGSVATDFEHRSYQEELLLCEWYFKKWLRSDSRLTDSDSRATYTGIAKAVNEAFFYMPFNMRVIPTSSYNDIGVHDAVGSVINAVGSNGRNAMGSFRLIFANGLTTGDILYIRWTSAASFIQFDAEL